MWNVNDTNAYLRYRSSPVVTLADKRTAMTNASIGLSAWGKWALRSNVNTMGSDTPKERIAVLRHGGYNQLADALEAYFREISPVVLQARADREAAVNIRCPLCGEKVGTVGHRVNGKDCR